MKKKATSKSSIVTTPKGILVSAASALERQQIERVNRVHGFFNSGGKASATEIAAKLRVSPRTVFRIYDILTDDWGMPLMHNASTKQSYYTRKVKEFPGHYATEGDIFTLMLANGALRECVEDDQRKLVQNTFRKVAANYKDLISFDIDYLDNCVSFSDTGKPILEKNLMQILIRAIAKRLQLKIWYDTPHKTSGFRIVNPYHLRKVGPDWLLFVYCVSNRQDVIRLALPRIHKPSFTGEKFIRPIDFNVLDYLKGAFGTYTGEELYPVGVYFTKQVAYKIKEKIWPCQKKLIQLPEGGVELHMELSSLMDVHPWILSFEGEAAPLFPVTLQEMYAAAQQKGMTLLDKVKNWRR